jgi:hypothetical protein
MVNPTSEVVQDQAIIKIHSNYLNGLMDYLDAPTITNKRKLIDLTLQEHMQIVGFPFCNLIDPKKSQGLLLESILELISHPEPEFNKLLGTLYPVNPENIEAERTYKRLQQMREIFVRYRQK